ncbi:SDR family NAD(P)-dependent oxidoreductase [Pseudonocardia acidicola]|uniref:SDR family NAD(P)-dependent oxidoreductase n=1 Tax=Pseudonocardia acidicola TaxID=2724939 RepID=A0ABX1SH69_9PSEU|nr:SDR family NAD(P)-dependent oxidoreductase [Pseudonocardia acidicola]NMI00927.1 SDR family NAD(P)-dependent oxidoreductase [Pseudonocardia acidicola]
MAGTSIDPVDDVLQGRRALVTGASGGIGQELGRRLAESGVDLFLTYSGHATEAEQLAGKARELGRRAEVMQADFADPASPARVIEAATERLGGLDVVVAAAGTGTKTPWEDVDEQLWDHTMAVNTRAPFFLAKLALPGMIERRFGRILLFSSIAAFNGGVIGPHYASSKAALHGLTHFLASRVADTGVTVNAIAPALIRGTRMLPAGPDDPLPLPIPVGRLGTVEEVADMSLAMLRNGYLTNKVITLDGGLYPS